MADPLTNYPLLQQILPEAYEYRICKFVEISPKIESGEENKQAPFTQFEATIRLKLKTKTEARAWIKAMEKTSAVTWRVDKTYPVCGGKKTQNVYRIDMRCQHRTYSRSLTASQKPSSKNTWCPAKMFLVVKRTHMASGKMSQSKDDYLQEFPTRVYLDFRHNHHLLSPEFLAKRDVSEETVCKLTDLFRAGHTPLSALEEIKRELQADYGDQFVLASSDRSKCPDKQFCYRLYYKLFYPKYSKSPGRKKLMDLQGRLKPFCKQHDLNCASIEETDDDFIIAVCAPAKNEVQNENSVCENVSVSSIVQPVNTEGYSPPLQIIEQYHNSQGEDMQIQSARQCQEGLRVVFDDIMSKLQNDLDFLRPVEAFIRNFQSIKKDQELASALETFGRFPGIAAAVTRSLKRQHAQDVSDSKTVICTKKRKGSRRQLITAQPLIQQQSPTSPHHSAPQQHNSITAAAAGPILTPLTSVAPTTPPLPSRHQGPPSNIQLHNEHSHRVHTINTEAHEVQAITLETQNYDVNETNTTTSPGIRLQPENMHESEGEILHEVLNNEHFSVVQEVTIPHHQHNHPNHSTSHHQTELQHHPSHLTVSSTHSPCHS
ncbi:hypothetical protein Pcinc_036099 [Petrolisthes cinctipes]|uniref:Uncharacterized protein n=1 Tax=Petrolisthes cinctipes TaxID=88211 RepID=A0AAE1BYE1_PETCI|nr:hypothetical protein Pcinc_036099 [Petrolisthes cinctipes]